MSVIIFATVIILLWAGYFFYGRLAARVFGIEPKRATPAFTKTDGVDYVPASNWLVLFGHHFASIAGAGPIIGPVLAFILEFYLIMINIISIIRFCITAVFTIFPFMGIKNLGR